MFRNIILCLGMIIALNNYLYSSTMILYNRLGARATGMGGAYTAIAESSDAILYNWAAKPMYKKMNFKIHESMILESPLYGITVENPLNLQWVRLGLLYSNTTDIPYTQLNSYGQPTLMGGQFQQRIYTAYTSFRHRLFGTDMGVRFSYFKELLANHYATAAQVDLAFMKKTRLFSKPTTLALVAKNPIPIYLKWSTQFKELLPWIIDLGYSTQLLDDKLTVSVDIEKQDNIKSLRFFGGIEYWLYGQKDTIPSIAVRGGLKNQDITMGVGIASQGWTIDYSYIQSRLFNHIDQSLNEAQHQFSIGYHFESLKQTIDSSTDKFGGIFDEDGLSKQYVSVSNELIPKKTMPSQPTSTILTVSRFKINPEANTYDYVQEETNEAISISLNHKKVPPTNQTFTNNLPIKLILKDGNSPNVLLMDLESTQTNAIIINGFLPKGIALMINGNKIIPEQNNGAFYAKILKNTEEDIIIEVVAIKL